MKIKHIEIHFHGLGNDALATISNQLEHIMSTQAETVERINAINATVTKIGEETRSLLIKIDELVAALAAAGTVSPEVDDAISALAEQAAVVDALVPDLEFDVEPVVDPGQA